MTRTIGKAAIAAIMGLSLLTAGACSRTERYTATGGAIGAGSGAIIGAATGGSAVGGAVIGGVVGAGAGYCIARDCLR